MLILLYVLVGCFRQGNGTRALGSSGGEAIHSDVQCLEGARRVSEAGALAGCPKPDPAELPTRQQRQCERAAVCGARLLPERHLSHHHPQGGFPWRRLLHLHLWHESFRFKAGTDVPHCYLWVSPVMTLILWTRTQFLQIEEQQLVTVWTLLCI